MYWQSSIQKYITCTVCVTAGLTVKLLQKEQIWLNNMKTSDAYHIIKLNYALSIQSQNFIESYIKLNDDRQLQSTSLQML